jgi:site-specific DNA-methyltransferase (adenine-specific)
MELRLGDYREVLDGVECDAVITDPPFSGRTHIGQRYGAGLSGAGYATERRAIAYAEWGDAEVYGAVNAWHRMARGWVCPMSDSDLSPMWREFLGNVGRVTFQPIPCVMRGMNVRLCGDGPSSWAVYLNASRPRTLEFAKWGTLPGAYTGGTGDRVHIGGKPLWLMRDIVRDYSRLGDLVCDPCAGAGTTLLAAAIEGRRAIGAEVDPETFELAVERLSQPYTPALQPRHVEPHEQGDLF